MPERLDEIRALTGRDEEHGKHGRSSCGSDDVRLLLDIAEAAKAYLDAGDRAYTDKERTAAERAAWRIELRKAVARLENPNG